ncbi:MAG: LSU ribosomal protein L15p (L27Ae), mitochondrial [Methanothrix sp.]|nr:MAG: LSU ribosomal protein L15p (L27Ae), mitochondrial [Methanothrix sp.]
MLPPESRSAPQAIPTAFHSGMDLMVGGILPPKSARPMEMYLRDRSAKNRRRWFERQAPLLRSILPHQDRPGGLCEAHLRYPRS